ncbi:MAG: hypothetical protein L0H37_01140 [Nitrosospira sp.]|nr:hypothetical protein [Nitrosospira sp.]
MNRAARHGQGATGSAERYIAGVLVRWANRYGVIATDARRIRGTWRIDTVFGSLTTVELARRTGQFDDGDR